MNKQNKLVSSFDPGSPFGDKQAEVLVTSGEKDNLDQVREQVQKIEEVEIQVLREIHCEMVFDLLSNPCAYMHRISDNVSMLYLIRDIKKRANCLYENLNLFMDDNFIFFNKTIESDDTALKDVINLFHCVTGINTEAGEILDIYKKVVFYNRGVTDKNKEMYLEESGDLRFFLAGGWSICSEMSGKTFKNTPEENKKLWNSFCLEFHFINQAMLRLDEQFGITERQSLEHNMWKLKGAPNARYKEGYSDQAATDRSDKNINGDSALPDSSIEKKKEVLKKLSDEFKASQLSEQQKLAEKSQQIQREQGEKGMQFKQ